MATKKTAAKAERYAIITADGYGLYAGIIESHDLDRRVVVARELRSVRYWYGRTGGTTSLAVYGLCGPKASQSRIGAPAPRVTISGVLNVYDCTPEARATFEATVQT